MVVNEDLKNNILEAIYDLSRKSDRIPVIEDKKKRIRFIEENCHIEIDLDYKIRMRFLGYFAYGYDFGKKETANYHYKNAVEISKKLSGGPNLEEFVSEGIRGRFGWYITKTCWERDDKDLP